MYGDPSLKPWTSSKWVPPGYITRKQRDEHHFRQRSVSGAPRGNGEIVKTESERSQDETLHEHV